MRKAETKKNLARRDTTRKDTNRVEKINSLIQHILSGVLLRYLIDRKDITTITKVQVSGDLRWAKIWIAVVAPGATNDQAAAANSDAVNKEVSTRSEKEVLGTLRNNIYEIQGELNRQMQVKMIPRLSFHIDRSTGYAQHLNEIFKKLADERNTTEAEQPH